MRSFGSDNNSGVHPTIMDAIIKSNIDHAIGYGDDKWTQEAKEAVRHLLNDETVEPLFVFNGTGANVIALQSCVSSYHSIICASTAHIAVDECGAPAKFTGCALKEIDTPDGKLSPALVLPYLDGFGVDHHSQPKVIAISQTTELGTAYSIEEIKELAELAHQHNMYLFVDGARLPNACYTLNTSLKELLIDNGVDIFTFGGTKNGLMMGEIVIPLRKELNENLRFYRKQFGQLYSKMRYLSAQFIPYISEGIWLENARKANEAAQKLTNKLKEIKEVKITQEVESNAIFFIIDKEISDELRKKYFFYDWNSTINEMRLVCSWDTSDDDIFNFINDLQSIINKTK